MQSRRFTFHHETHAVLRTSVQVAFEYLDDFRKLSAHMEQPSAMMLGSRMQIFLDDGGGRAVGSRVTMTGSIMGLSLSLQEVVVERNPPLRKAWETENARLLVIGQYRLGFDLEPRDGACGLRVFIDYDWPRGPLARLAARMLAKSYEGHVPAREVRRLLAERPAALGLSVPGMPRGSPGMEGAVNDPYDVLLVARDGRTTVFQSYR